jgi:hypothetical protein
MADAGLQVADAGLQVVGAALVEAEALSGAARQDAARVVVTSAGHPQAAVSEAAHRQVVGSAVTQT